MRYRQHVSHPGTVYRVGGGWGDARGIDIHTFIVGVVTAVVFLQTPRVRSVNVVRLPTQDRDNDLLYNLRCRCGVSVIRGLPCPHYYAAHVPGRRAVLIMAVECGGCARVPVCVWGETC